MSRILTAFIIMIELLVVANKTLSVSAQGEPIIDCATVVNDGSFFQGSILSVLHEDEGNRFLFNNAEGVSLDYAPAPLDFLEYYDSVSMNVLFWEVVHTGDGTRAAWLEVWSLETNQTLNGQISVPITFRPRQWLQDGRFLFSAWSQNEFLVFSTETNSMEVMASVSDFPNMPLIPIGFRSSYDLAFSPDGRYVAYEYAYADEIIRPGQRGIAIWDTQEVREIARFTFPESGIAVSLPVWSHDSQKLALALFVETEMQLFLFDVDSGQETQITDFTTQLPDEEFGRPWATFQTILWSPSNRYIAFRGVRFGVHILDIQTMIVTDVCINETPVFWLPSGDHLVLGWNSIYVLDVIDNQIHTVADTSGRPIGWSPLTIDDLLD